MSTIPFKLTDPRTAPETLLIRMALDGHHGAFAELIERSRERCMRVALRLLRNRENAEDEVQNAFCKAYTRLDTFNQEAEFSTWASRIVINECYMRMRQTQKFRPVPIHIEGQDRTGRHHFEPVEWRNPEQTLAVAQIHGLMQSELQRVPQLLRIPLELHVLQELPLREVARRLKTSVTAVKSRVYRGQCFLRDRMNQHCKGSGRNNAPHEFGIREHVAKKSGARKSIKADGNKGFIVHHTGTDSDRAAQGGCGHIQAQGNGN